MWVGFVENKNFYIFFQKFYIYYLAGYLVSGKIIGRKKSVSYL